MSEQSHPEHVRRTAQQIVERLHGDPVFRQQVQTDPVDALVAAGLPERALADFIRELNLTADVSGYEFISQDISSYSCCITDVPNEGIPGDPINP